MNPVSQPSQNPNQPSSVSNSTPSYSSAAKKVVSSSPVAAGSLSQPSIVAVGSSGSVQPNHGKSSSALSLNGKHSISPAVPTFSTPTIAYSSSIMNGAPNHNRKSSVTINSNGRHPMNGGPVGGSGGKIQFGSITDSTASSHTAPQTFQHTTSAPISMGNPRISEPSHSPSPIPQPSASGGRPPVVGPGNCVNFGSFSGDNDRHIQQSPAPQHASVSDARHGRHDSTQSGQSDLSNQQGRSGFHHQSNRGRSGFQYQQHQIGGFSPQSTSFRNTQGQGRSSISPFQGQGRLQFPNSPHQASRSPALSSSIPGTPNMNPSMPLSNQQQYSNPYYQQSIPGYQYNCAQYDTRTMPIPATNSYIYPHFQNISFMSGPPQSPQTGFQQLHYAHGQYAPQPQQMSRNSSQISDQQPASSMAPPRTPSLTSIVHPLTPQSKPSSTTNVPFTIPNRKSAAITIKWPDGEAVDIESFKVPSSPAPSTRARTPPIIASVSVLPPKPTTLHHSDDSPISKTKDQIKKEYKEKVQKVAAENHPTDVKLDDQVQDSEAISQKDVVVVKSASGTKAEEEEEEKEEFIDVSDNKSNLDDDLERQIVECEAAQLEMDRKEQELLKKRDAERELAKAQEEKNRKIAQEEENKRLREQEREMERLEDEKEKKRAQAELKNCGGPVKSVKELLNETSLKKEDVPSSSIRNTQIPKVVAPAGIDVSLSSTTNEPMGPPPKISSAEKRLNKPSALNLTPLNGKSVEPPQPSAALRSLKSARFLTVLDPMIYPPQINSPNPALNQAVKDKGRSFKYDKEFLLQFQKVFVEKPSMEFESQIKALISESDNGPARVGTSRASESMASRSNSSRNSTHAGFNTGNMGAFASSGSGKTLPPGTTSEQRYAMSSGTVTRSSINSMSPFIRPRNTGFPAGNPISRNPSNPSMPHSPRQQSRRGNASSKGYNPSGAKQEAQAAKTMPLTAGVDVKPIQISATGWKPRSVGNSQSSPALGASTHMDPDMVQRKVKAALNKMTPEKFDKIADQILSIASQSKDEADGRTLRQVIQLTFEKATDEAHWAAMYAKFCKRMLETMSPDIRDETILDKNGEVVSGGHLFRKYLLNRCQEEFERGWKIDLPKKPEDKVDEEKTEEAVLLSDEYYVAAAAKRRGLGLVQFIGELYKLSMLTERIMHECVRKLVDCPGVPDEAEVESLTKLLKTIGSNVDESEKGKQMMNFYFERISNIIETPELPSRLRFMLMDISDLRKKKWASEESNKGPKTLEEVRIEAEKAAAQKAAESARNSQRGGGGGSRMAMGRGDSRNFSNQYGNQPLSDLQKDLVGIDEIRGLRNNSTRASSQQMKLGPSSLLSKSNSQRKPSPGGSFNRVREELGVSSRTSMPSQQKEKESTTSVNSYSLLAALGTSEIENPTSPPSTSASPALPKATPASMESSAK